MFKTHTRTENNEYIKIDLLAAAIDIIQNSDISITARTLPLLSILMEILS